MKCKEKNEREKRAILYDTNIAPNFKLIRCMLRKGARMETVAKKLDVSEVYLRQCRSKYIELQELFNTARQDLTDKIEAQGLYKRALGYDYEEVQKKVEILADGTKKQYIITKTKHVPPDIMAIMFYLTNKSNGEYKHKDHHDMNIKGMSGLTKLLKEYDSKKNKI